jgi:hypothetical protein
MTSRSISQGTIAGLNLIVGVVVATSFLGPPSGIWSDATARWTAAPRAAGRSPPLERWVEEEVANPFVDDPARADPAPADPAPARPPGAPRFLGTLSTDGEMRAIFLVPGRRRPWLGRPGERIEGTRYVVEEFDGTGARLREVADP